LASKKALSEIIDFGASQVFDATTYTCLLFLSNRENESFRFLEAKAGVTALGSAKFGSRKTDSLGKDAWVFADDETKDWRTSWRKARKRLLDLPRI